MGAKGDRASKEPLAQRLYAEGKSLTAISEQLDVSDTTLRKWKGDSMPPGGGIDEWDRARQQRRSMTSRLRDLCEEQLAYVEGLHPSERTAPVMDGLSKLTAVWERTDKTEKTREVAEEVTKQIKKAGLSDDAADDIRRRILGIGE